MGRKKNLQVLHKRRIHLQKIVDSMPDTAMSKDDFEDELEALQWALKKLEAQEISVGDRVTLYVYPEEYPDEYPDEESEQAEEGVVIGYSSGGYLIRPSTGKYSGTLHGLWYHKDHVTLLDK